MLNLAELQQTRTHKVLTRQEILDKADKAEGGPRPLTPDECAIFDRLTEDITNLDGQISAVEATIKRQKESQELVAKLSEPAGRQTQADRPATSVEIRSALATIPARARRTGKLKAFKPKQGESQDSADMRAYRSGLWIRASLFNDQRAAQRCYELGVPLDLRNAMSTTDNANGGFLVPDELNQAIIDLREMYGVFRQNCRVWPMGSDTLLIPRRTGGVTISLVGENPSSISQSNPTFDMVTLVAKKFGGLTLMSSEIAEDAVIDLAAWIADEFAYAFANFEDTAGFTGDGTSTYGGIRGLTNLMTETSALAGAVLATAGHDTFAEVDNTDLTSVMGKLPAYARMNAKWFISAMGYDIVFNRLAAAGGGNTTQTLRDGIGPSYLGYPIVISQVLYSSTSAQTDGSPLLFFGDLMKSSNMGDRRAVRIFPSEHRYMDTDQIGIRGTERIDINNSDVGTTTAAGPIVALLANAS